MLLFSQIVVAPCMQQQCQLLKRWTTLPAGNCALLSLSMARLVLSLPQCHLQILRPVITLWLGPFLGWDFESLQKSVKPVSHRKPYYYRWKCFLGSTSFSDRKGEQGGVYMALICASFFSMGPFPRICLTLFQASMQQVLLWTLFHSPSIHLCHDLQKEQRWPWVNGARHPKWMKVKHLGNGLQWYDQTSFYTTSDINMMTI